MKSFKKFTSLFLALVMLVGMFSISALAAEAPDPGAPTGEVTVYFTKGMLTKGGLNSDQQFIGMSQVNRHLFDSTNRAFSIQTLDLSGTGENVIDYAAAENVYHFPGAASAGTAFQQYNVLDAIVAALTSKAAEGVVTSVDANWDAHPYEGQPGGYINSFSPDGIPVVNETRTETVGTEKYTVYSGTGWQIIVIKDGVPDMLTSYATSEALQDGMEIVFDLSEYEFYYPAT